MLGRSIQTILCAMALVLALSGINSRSDGQASTNTSAPPPAAVPAPAVGPATAPDATSEPASSEPAIVPPTPRPLMQFLDFCGIGKPMTDAGIKLYGYVEGSYNNNSSHPVYNPAFGVPQNTDHLFDFEDDVFRMNQLDLTLERPIDFSATQFDVGFRLEGIYGSDSRLIHANGLDFNGANGHTNPYNGNYNWLYDQSPSYQPDLYQAYVDIGIPVGNGLRLRLGKFAAFFGGTVDPNGNTFYSHTIAFALIHPFTFTGAMATYKVNDDLRVDLGFSRGWDQATEDDNGSLDGFARIAWAITDQVGLTVAASEGPEDQFDNKWRTELEATLKYYPTDALRFVVDGTYGFQPHYNIAASGETIYVPSSGATLTAGVENAEWYGVALYAGYTIDPHVTVNARGEFFRDEEGVLSDVASTDYEVTLGLTITPLPDDKIFKNFKVRPEGRVDFSSQRIYGDFTRKDQELFEIDAIFNF